MYDPRVCFFSFFSTTPSDSWMVSKMSWFGKRKCIEKYNFHEQMALKAATQHFTYSTVSATSSQDSQPAHCDWTVCYMLALSCGGVLQKICAIPNESDTLSAVCAFGSVLLSSEIRPHPPEAKKSRVFSSTCVMLQGLCPVAAKALTSAMTVFSINLHYVFFFI